jgi:error-prone DNA polymerase
VLCSGETLAPRLELHTIPPEDPLVYDMIDNADTIGVFQIESRAQMTMLPRLRPRCFYDLVIEVAIVRPGPIQGDMVHPYLRRRQGLEPVEYPSEELRQVLGKTLGVPLFQEQAMRLVMVAASFSAEQADKLRRAMAAWRRNGVLEQFHPRVVEGMVRNGYSREFAERCFQQIRGFGEYGFPESHAASFALLVYASAWLKCHYPAVFAAALLNSQPMGFYAPAQIVRDAKDHGVQVRPVDVNESQWDCTLEGCTLEGSLSEAILAAGPKGRALPLAHSPMTLEQQDAGSAPQPGLSDRLHGRSAVRNLRDPALRLGFRQIKGFREAYAKAIVAARGRISRFTSIHQFQQLARLPVSAIRLLAQADAFGSLGLTRRQAMWQATTLKNEEFPLFENRDGSGISPPENPEPSRFCAADGSNSVPLFNDQRSSSVPLCEPERSSFPLSDEPAVQLPAMPLGQEVAIDYAATGLSLKRHPVDLVREQLSRRGILCARQMLQKAHGQWVKVAGLVLVRQRPGTASGVVFVTIEDESGVVNLILHPTIYERFRPAARHARLLQADGYVQRDGQVVHVLAKRLFDVSDLLADLEVRARDFH